MKYLIILSAIAAAAACTPSNAEDSKDGKDGLKFAGSTMIDEIDVMCWEHYAGQNMFAQTGQTFEGFKETLADDQLRLGASFCKTDLYSHRCIKDVISPLDGSVLSRTIAYEQLVAPDGTILGSPDEVEYSEEVCLEDGAFGGFKTVWQAAPFPD